MQSLNSAPYFDDFDEAKDFHKILYKPGIPVQARELTQVQTILQTQISRFGDHIFVNGARVSGGQVSANNKVFSAKLVNNTNLSSVSAGVYLKGETSGLTAEVTGVYSETYTSSPYVVYVARTKGTNGSKFLNDEIIYFYSDFEMTTQVAAHSAIASGTINQTLISGSAGYDKLTATDITKVAVGAYIASLDAYVISVDTTTNSFRINKELSDTITSQQVDISIDAVTPSILFGVTDGIFYINGYFARVGQQSIVPALTNRWCNKTIGLTESETIIDSDMDSTLLDPAQGSYNYAAPGADRLKVSLTLVAYDHNDITDPNFIELMRVEDGVVVRQSKNTEYSELMNTIARRTYDESGNYVVSPFIISMKDDGAADKISAVINPGKAYVGGYEFETITPTKLPLARALETEISTNFMVNTFVGNYVHVNSITGPIPSSGTTVNIELGGVVKGTAVFMGMSPYATGIKLYLANISGTIATGMSVVAGSFHANIASEIKDTNYKLNVFPFPQSYVKNVSAIDYKTKRLFKNVVFTNGVATISGSNTNERFSGGTGTLPDSIANTYYAVFNAAGTSFTVTKPAVSANSIDQCQLDIGVPTYNGTGDIIATIDVNHESSRLKTLTPKLVDIATVTSTEFASLGYADLYAIKYAAVNPAQGVNKGIWAAGAYTKFDVVGYSGVLYQASANTSATDIPGTSSIWAKLPDVSSTITSDNGQRDGWYDHAGVKSKSGDMTKVFVLFDYFSHAGAGMITVNSYPVAYTSIPSYTTSTNATIELKDAIDSRPRRKDNSTTLEFDTYQVPDDLGIELTIEYYLSRIDKIVLTNSRTFKVLKGVSSYSQPLPPADVADAMTLAVVVVPPYTNSVAGVQVRPVSNRRYTMRDIGVIEQRLGNVEYYTSISNLESNILNSTQYAPNGSELFKSGFIADNFDSFSIGNVLSPEYQCSIDINSGVCRPQFKMHSLKLGENAMLSGTQRTGDLITLPYVSKTLIKNVMPTSVMNVNPFSAFANVGSVQLSPSSDYWFDETTTPQVNILDDNTRAMITAQTAAVGDQQVQWGTWVTNWIGSPTSASSSTNLLQNGLDSGRNGVWQTLSSQQVSTDAIQYRSKEVQSVSSAAIVSGDGTKVVSRETQPFIRARDVAFNIDGMTPLTALHVWVDDVLVDQHITPSFSTVTGTILSTNLTATGSGYTNASVTIVGNGTGAIITPVVNAGKVTGLVITNAGEGYTTDPTIIITGDGTGALATASITLPSKGATLYSDKYGKSNGILSFPAGIFTTGTHQISFTDSATSNRSETSEAVTIYTADGYVDTTQRGVSSTRAPMIVAGGSSGIGHDPMAQTFFIEQQNGVFVQSVDLYFASKDQSSPVTIEIRPTVNGYPSSGTIVPLSVVTKYPDAVSVSSDGTVATTFTFKSPVYLTAGEYALVITTGSNKYSVYVAEMNKQIIGTTKVISDQPYIGSLFESQNAAANSADQFKDLCFELRTCEFSKTSKTLVLNNTEVGMHADIVHAVIQNLQPASTSITAVATLPTYTGNFVFDTDVTLAAQSSFASVGDAAISIALNTTDSNISPVIDLERTALIGVENIINDGQALTVPETTYQNGGAIAKYATSRIVLNQGFNASNLVVYLSVNRPQESAIEVYFRAKNEFDTTELSNKSWVKLSQETNGGNTSQEGQYVEDKWSVYDYTYDTFNEFNTYEVKVVMYSSNTSRVPIIADIRAIALA